MSQFRDDQLVQFGKPPTIEQLVERMNPEQRQGARAKLGELELNAKTPADLEQIAKGYLMLDEKAPDAGQNAVRIAVTIQQMEPEKSEGFTLAASGYHQMGDYPAATQWARDALKRNPIDETAKAVFMLSVGRVRRSGAGLKEAAGSGRQQGAGVGAPEWAIPEKDVSPQALSLMKQAVAARRAGQMGQTMALAQAAMNADPTSAGVQKFYGLVEAENKKHADTTEFLRLSKEALEAGRGADAAMWAQKAAARSQHPTVYKILEVTKLRAEKLAQESTARELESKKNAPGGDLPVWPVGAGLGLAAIGYGLSRSRSAWSQAESEPPEDEDPNSERIQRNRYRLKVGLAAAAIGFGVIYGGPIVVRTAAPVLAAAWKSGSTSLQRVATSQAGAINPQTGSVWNYIKPTQPNWPGTEIPKSFEVTVRAGRIWVHPNATEHMWEFLGKVKAPDRMISRPPIQSQVLLDSFRSALDQATKQGIQYGRKMNVGQWEIIIDQRASDALPVVMHAKYTH